jgi:thiosulfate/3-mercaptopyruvate sulfurtransferase
MRPVYALLFVASVGVFGSSCSGSAEKTTDADAAIEATTGEPWKQSDLLEPADLAYQLADPAKAPVVFDLGPAGTIKGAQKIGPAQEPENIAKLRTALAGLSKDQPVVVYCGCCPFEPCPNIRPAFRAVKQAGFTHVKLLNLKENLKADWIDHGYPMATK